MKKLIPAFLLCFCTNIYSQSTFNFQYDLEYQFKVLTSVLPTDSCYYITGIVTDTVGQTYRAGLLFLKLGLDGEILNEKKIVSDSAWYQPWRGDLIASGDGNFIDVGYKSDSVQTAFLMKFDPEGDTLFSRTYFNPFFPDDDFIVTASTKMGTNGDIYLLCGIDNNPVGNNGDIYLLNLNKEGEVLDSFVYGSPSDVEVPYSMLIDDDGGALIGANQTNRGFVSSGFYSKAYIFNVNASGQIQWEYTSNSPQLFDIAYDMVKTPDGGLVIATGKGIEQAINTMSSRLIWNAYLLKLNADHQKEWGIEMRGTRPSSETGFRKVVEAVDGSGYIAMGNLGEDVTTGEEVYGSWVVKVSTEGDSLWARYYSYFDSIKSEPRPKDFKATPDGGYVIVGETRPYYPDGQVQRAWIMKLDEDGCLIPGCDLVDTNEKPASPLQLAIYPNPTTGYLNFQLRSDQVVKSATFRIVDASGKIMQEIESNMPMETHIVPVWDWPSGVYFLQYMENGSVRHSERFVVLKK